MNIGRCIYIFIHIYAYCIVSIYPRCISISLSLMTTVTGASGPAQLADALATPGALQSVGIPEALELEEV